jgi:hypothetical protein
VTEETVKALRYDARMQGLALKKQLASMDTKLKQLYDKWRELGDTFRDTKNNTFRIVGDEVEVIREEPNTLTLSPNRPATNTIASVSLRYLDAEALAQLLIDIEHAKCELRKISKVCAEMGDPL